MDPELFSRPAILAPIFLAISYIVYQIFLKPSPVSQLNLPIVGARPGDWFPYTQAQWRNYRDFRAAALEADRLSRAANPENPHQAVLFPVLGGTPNLIYLPRSEIKFVIDQPDPVGVDMHGQVVDTMQLDYILSDPHLVRDPIWSTHHKMVATTLTSQIPNLVPDLADETAWLFKHLWELDPGQSKDVLVFDTLRRVISGTTNRVTVGLPLCRDEEFQHVSVSHASLVATTGQVMSWIWKPFKPLVALVTAMPLKRISHRFCELLRPEVKRRLAEYDAHQAALEKKSSSGAVRNDFLQWTINQAKTVGSPYLLSPETLAGRIALLNFSGIHTTAFAVTHALLDLVYSPNREQIIAELREEIESCLDKYGEPRWKKASLNAMHKLDSLLRESGRLNSIVNIGLPRKVSAPEGLLTPHSKIRIPKGTSIAVPAYAVFRDPETYPSPDEFKPFRFAEQRADSSEENSTRARAGKAFPSTSAEYLVFGHGKTACPGRFFVANELMLVMAHIVLHYDLGPGKGQTSRPENKWYGMNVLPDLGASIRVTRREKTSFS
ncbi:cytochrome P450 [Rhypophila decipiens]|uniref:Cytochrome P450 n=1 Tax=Rhypophila decipiens TaxID=261697 RepID=A0AAN7BBT1_9PEZI|nr:cytochrome P450 [Rhypophila decipiens]